ETALPVTEIAFASGFASLRRFNDAFSSRYRMAPTRLRKKAIDGASTPVAGSTSKLQLAYRPPYDWPGILAFLRARELKGVEFVTEDSYARTVHLANHEKEYKGWLRVTRSEKKNTLNLEFSNELAPVLPALLSRVRDLFDLNARPDIINKHLR